MSLRKALTYGLPMRIPNASYNKIESGSYGTVYSLQSKNIVFKKHDINSEDMKCSEWEHEYLIHKSVYNKCINQLKKYDICIAKPYTFRYIQDANTSLNVVTAPNNASACIYTMDYIPGGTKWDKYLKTPLKKFQKPPYVYLGALKDGINIITLNMLKDATIIQMPNESYNFCKTPGKFGNHIQFAMIESVFIFIKNGFMPRDIEYVMDGRKHTQTFVAIIDFNQVKRIEERAALYGDGYDVNLDTAHVYIDLCGLRKGRNRNPMAPYDQDTPQWTFLCNPIVCPSTFLECMQPYRYVAEIILEYAFNKYILPTLNKYHCKTYWKPLYVYRVQDESEITDGDFIIGTYTEQEYYTYRNHQCVFHVPKGVNELHDATKYIYVESAAHRYGLYAYDKFVEYDIQFQHYILCTLSKSSHESGDFYDILDRELNAIAVPQIQQSEEWDTYSLFS